MQTFGNTRKLHRSDYLNPDIGNISLWSVTLCITDIVTNYINLHNLSEDYYNRGGQIIIHVKMI